MHLSQFAKAEMIPIGSDLDKEFGNSALILEYQLMFALKRQYRFLNSSFNAEQSVDNKNWFKG